MSYEDEEATVVLLASEGTFLAQGLSFDTAITLIALVSEDPSNWTEAQSVWSRYRTVAVDEFVESLPINPSSREECFHEIEAADSWIAIDFVNKRVFTGGNFMPLESDSVFSMHVDEDGDHHDPLSIHLPPWWELHTSASAGMITEARGTPLSKPSVDREVLYGDALLEYIATNVLRVIESEPWLQSHAGDEKGNQYPFTVQVHRDWLMTPRLDLNGRMPRQLLHGATGWLDKVKWGQQRRFEDGAPMIAAPDDWTNYQTAPMGTEEISLYFDLCRELIQAGWLWFAKAEDGDEISNRQQQHLDLVTFLKDVRDIWLESSFEGGTPPSFIIECERRRVPRGSGVAIEGIEGVESEQHVDDCDCPICEMMADGLFGVGFTSIDGYHLEMDNEFAFSLYETREEWEEQQIEYVQYSERRSSEGDADRSIEAEDEFPAVWFGIKTTDNLPGDKTGTLKLAFMLAEVISTLESMDAPYESIQRLNMLFSSYRRSSSFENSEPAIELQEFLQTLSETYPALISKSADLQSQIDGALRSQ